MVRMDDGSVSVSTGNDEYQAKALVIAEGATSRSASRVFGPYPRKDMSIGMMSICELGNMEIGHA